MDNVKIRRARLGDEMSLAQLATQMGYPVTASEAKKRLKDILRQKGEILLVADVYGQAIGYVLGTTIIEINTPKTLRLGGMVVNENYRQWGIGRMLMKGLEKWTKQEKFEMILVPTNIKRKNAHKFYEKIGYERFKTQYLYLKEFNEKH